MGQALFTTLSEKPTRIALSYDGHGRQDRWTFPSETRPGAFNDSTPATALATAGSVNAVDYEGYGYDANGNRTTLRKRDNAAYAYGDIHFQYDALNRLTLKTVPERPAPHPYPLAPAQTRDVHYGYDLGNRQTYARFDSISGEGITNAYDGFGRLTSTSSNMGGTARTLTSLYDLNSNRTAITHPDGNWFGMVYDGMGRPTFLHSNWTAGIAYAYRNAAGDVAASARNNVPVNYGYDSVQRLTSIIHETVGQAQF